MRKYKLKLKYWIQWSVLSAFLFFYDLQRISCLTRWRADSVESSATQTVTKRRTTNDHSRQIYFWNNKQIKDQKHNPALPPKNHKYKPNGDEILIMHCYMFFVLFLFAMIWFSIIFARSIYSLSSDTFMTKIFYWIKTPSRKIVYSWKN